jgi:hypothetical protein
MIKLLRQRIAGFTPVITHSIEEAVIMVSLIGEDAIMNRCLPNVAGIRRVSGG